jgi:hypothetical protein
MEMPQDSSDKTVALEMRKQLNTIVELSNKICLGNKKKRVILECFEKLADLWNDRKNKTDQDIDFVRSEFELIQSIARDEEWSVFPTMNTPYETVRNVRGISNAEVLQCLRARKISFLRDRDITLENIRKNRLWSFEVDDIDYFGSLNGLSIDCKGILAEEIKASEVLSQNITHGPKVSRNIMQQKDAKLHPSGAHQHNKEDEMTPISKIYFSKQVSEIQNMGLQQEKLFASVLQKDATKVEMPPPTPIQKAPPQAMPPPTPVQKAPPQAMPPPTPVQKASKAMPPPMPIVKAQPTEKSQKPTVQARKPPRAPIKVQVREAVQAKSATITDNSNQYCFPATFKHPVPDKLESNYSTRNAMAKKQKREQDDTPAPTPAAVEPLQPQKTEKQKELEKQMIHDLAYGSWQRQYICPCYSFKRDMSTFKNLEKASLETVETYTRVDLGEGTSGFRLKWYDYAAQISSVEPQGITNGIRFHQDNEKINQIIKKRKQVILPVQMPSFKEIMTKANSTPAPKQQTDPIGYDLETCKIVSREAKGDIVWFPDPDTTQKSLKIKRKAFNLSSLDVHIDKDYLQWEWQEIYDSNIADVDVLSALYEKDDDTVRRTCFHIDKTL